MEKEGAINQFSGTFFYFCIVLKVREISYCEQRMLVSAKVVYLHTK